MKKVKLCERCNIVSIEVTSSSKKYCDECRIIARKEVENRSYKKGGIGIYKITNTVNNKVYIGQSVSLHKRMLMHKNELKRNQHGNVYMQRAFNKYGEKGFIFEIIEYCKEDELYKRENFWIKYHKSHIPEFGYNIILPSSDERKFRMSIELKNNLSEKNRKYCDEELISFLQEYYYHYGIVPSVKEFDKNKNYPSRKTYENRFGGFKEALIEADLYDFDKEAWRFDIPIKYTKNEIINTFQLFIDRYGRFPSNKELKSSVEYNIVSYDAINAHFSSIEELRGYFNFTKEEVKRNELNESLKALGDLYELHGKINLKLIRDSETTRSYNYYRNNFNSMYEACLLAGIPDEQCIKSNSSYKNMDRNKITDNDLRIEFKRVFDLFYNKNKRYPSKREFISMSTITEGTFRRRLNLKYSEMPSYYGYA